MPSTVLSGLYVLIHSILTEVLRNGSIYDYPHYADGETKTRKDKQLV